MLGFFLGCPSDRRPFLGCQICQDESESSQRISGFFRSFTCPLVQSPQPRKRRFVQAAYARYTHVQKILSTRARARNDRKYRALRKYKALLCGQLALCPAPLPRQRGGGGTPAPTLATRCRPAPIYTQRKFEGGWAVIITKYNGSAAYSYKKLYLPLGVGLTHIALKRSVTRCKRR